MLEIGRPVGSGEDSLNSTRLGQSVDRLLWASPHRPSCLLSPFSPYLPLLTAPPRPPRQALRGRPPKDSMAWVCGVGTGGRENRQRCQLSFYSISMLCPIIKEALQGAPQYYSHQKQALPPPTRFTQEVSEIPLSSPWRRE